MKPLILGLGNELLGDDGVGILAARRLAGELAGQADVVECNLSGIALLDVLTGYRQAVIMDSIPANGTPPGSVLRLSPAELGTVMSPSPHYTGLPEMIMIADRLDLEFPLDIEIFAVTIADPHAIGGAMTQPVKDAMDELVNRVKKQVRRWRNQDRRT
jgi:hydrogenase maturation protease